MWAMLTCTSTSRGFWPPLAGFLCVAALVVAPPGAAALNCQYRPLNKTCLFNTSYEGTSIFINTTDDVQITGSVSLVATQGNFEIHSTGSVFIDSEVILLATQGDFEIHANGKVQIDSEAKATTDSADATLSGAQGSEATSSDVTAVSRNTAQKKLNIKGASILIDTTDAVVIANNVSLVATQRNLEIHSTATISIGSQAEVTSELADVLIVGALGVEVTSAQVNAGKLHTDHGKLTIQAGNSKSAGLLDDMPTAEAWVKGSALLANSNIDIYATGQVHVESQASIFSRFANVSVVGAGSVTVSFSLIAAAISGNGTTGSLRIEAGCGSAKNSNSNSNDVDVVQVGVTGSKLEAHRNLEIGGPMLNIGKDTMMNSTAGTLMLGTTTSCKCDTDLTISGTGVILNGSSVHLNCSSSVVKVDHGVAVMARGPEIAIQNDQGSVLLFGNVGGPPVQANKLRIVAGGDIVVNTSIQGADGSNSLCSLDFRSGGNVLLPDMQGQWILNQVSIFGKTVTVGVPLIFTQGTSCANKQTAGDVCPGLLDNASLAESLGDRLRATLSNVSFDCLIVGQESVQLSYKSRLKAASMLLCSGGTLQFENNTILDVSGRGCSAGVGAGTGGTRNESAKCGAGGGSHISSGGFGGSFDSTEVTPCATPGRFYDQPDLEPTQPLKVLPTAGASGGGCTGYDNKVACSRLPRLTSAGGGLIWLSAKGAMTFQSNVQVLASGKAGAEVAVNTTTNSTTASGGGSGGQIFLFANMLTMTDTSADHKGVVYFQATGGEVGCTRFLGTGTGAVGGGGGGGFIGFQVSSAILFPQNRTEFMYKGGKMSKDCATMDLPSQGLQYNFGKSGLAAPITPCPAGHSGILCLPCPNGTWSPAGSLTCSDCTNKPNAHAYYPYDGSGNSKSLCPYLCEASVPEVRSNPKCLGTFEYLFEFYGGTAGTIALSVCLVVFVIFLFWRRIMRKRRLRLGRSISVEHRGTWIARLIGSLCDCLTLASGASRQAGQMKSSKFHFPREHLPFYICRVFLHGSNRESSRWTLDLEMPQRIHPLVLEPRWTELSMKIERAAKVGKMEKMVEMALRWLYPPLAPVVARRCRQQRAKKIQKLVKDLSEAENGRQPFWKPIRARVCSANAGLGVTFGCDASATLGYLDFFDFSRNPLDYYVDLQRDAYLLPVHGYGTFDEPFAIDAGDPLVWHLTHTDLGCAAVSSVILTFNRVCRVLAKRELDHDGMSQTMTLLVDKVKQCIQQLGELSGSVLVMSIHQNYKSPPPGTLLADSVNLGGLDQSTASFSDLARVQTLLPRLESGAIARDHRHGKTTLCLTFTNLSTLTEETRSPEEGLPSFTTASSHGAMVSPTDSCELREQIARSSDASSEHSHATSFTHQEVLFRYLSCRSAPVVPRCLAWTTPASILFLLVLFSFLDALGFVAFFVMFAQVLGRWTFVWLLLPPLVEPITIILGVVFVVSEFSVIGRAYVSFVFCSLLSTTLGTVGLLVASDSSWMFWMTQWLLRCALKLALFGAANLHLVNMMSLWDQCYLECANGGEFVTDLLANDGARRPINSTSYQTSFGRSFGGQHSSPLLNTFGAVRRGAGGADALEIRGQSSRSPRGTLAWSGIHRLNSLLSDQSGSGRPNSRVDIRSISPRDMSRPPPTEPSPF
mmetsp:Transcript_5592/g.21105  ORF Transcript_5592/g.21105 Transcript_5592/m.21105 type:complete len:1655 (+) Transcript_5592:43-5007(+)